MIDKKFTPVSKLIENFNNGSRLPTFSYADIPLGDCTAEISNIYADEARKCICVSFLILQYNITLQQMFFVESGDNECLKFFNFLNDLDVEILPDYLLRPDKSGVIGKKCLINVNVSGNNGRIFKNALFLRLI